MVIQWYNPHLFPQGRDQLEVFLVENEMHSPGARVGAGDALLIKGVSQGFRSAEEDSYSGTFGEKKRKKKTVLGFGMGSITKHMGRFPTDSRPQSSLLSSFVFPQMIEFRWPLEGWLGPIYGGSWLLQKAADFIEKKKWHSSKVYGNFYHRENGGEFVSLWSTSFQGSVFSNTPASF